MNRGALNAIAVAEDLYFLTGINTQRVANVFRDDDLVFGGDGYRGHFSFSMGQWLKAELHPLRGLNAQQVQGGF